MIKFLHAADLHLDSPFSGLRPQACRGRRCHCQRGRLPAASARSRVRLTARPAGGLGHAHACADRRRADLGKGHGLYHGPRHDGAATRKGLSGPKSMLQRPIRFTTATGRGELTSRFEWPAGPAEGSAGNLPGAGYTGSRRDRCRSPAGSRCGCRA